MRGQDVQILTEVTEYAGQEAVKISCTQLGTRYSATQARSVVTNWVDFLESGPSAIHDLKFVSRTPKRLFAALHAQTQLRRLAIKWGDYDDLSVLNDLHGVRELTLHGGLLRNQRQRSRGPNHSGAS